MIHMNGNKKKSILKINGCHVYIWFNKIYNII